MILVVIDHYLPGTRSGGPVRTISNLVAKLSNEFDFIILTRDRDIGDEQPYPNISSSHWHQVGNAQVRYLAPKELLFPRFIRIVRAVKCDLWMLNGVFPSLVLRLVVARKLRLFGNSPVVVAPRGHLEHGALSLKSGKKRLFLALAKTIGLYRNIHWLCASQSEKHDILREFGPDAARQAIVVSNSTNLSVRKPTEQSSDKVPGNLRVSFLSRVSQKKNLDFALRILADVCGSVQFDIYGPREDREYWEQCEDAIRALPSNISVNYWASVEQDDVVPTLAKYHLFFLPTLGENFGHAILEALSAGCPVLISDRTPWNNVNMHGAGWALSLDQPERFHVVLQHMIDADQQTIDMYRQNARAYAQAYLDNSTAAEDMHAFLHEVAALGRRM